MHDAVATMVVLGIEGVGICLAIACAIGVLFLTFELLVGLRFRDLLGWQEFFRNARRGKR